jgi:hypothetical protein
LNYIQSLKNDNNREFAPLPNSYSFTPSLLSLLKTINNPKTAYDPNIALSFFQVNFFLSSYAGAFSPFDYKTAYHDFLIANDFKNNYENINAYAFQTFCQQSGDKYKLNTLNQESQNV